MDEYFKRAIANVIRHGDTDIFPFPIENHIFFDKEPETLGLLKEIHKDFDGSLSRYPPAHDAALAPVNYTGFRWATQIDPLWNLYFLALVLSIAQEVESARLPTTDRRVFSYRYCWSDETGDIFDDTNNWRGFMECSLEHARQFKFVVVCDISEFYPRLGHHRLENALLQLAMAGDAHSRIMSFLKNFSNTNSFGLPVGGPAARILSELVLNQIDRLLELEGITFCRFADDFHIFCESNEDAYARLEPIFPGCGIIDACRGDLIVSNILFEVKAGDRLFRSVDVRQLITYATLNQISKRFTIEKVGLFNPRIGVSATISVDDLCFEISGKNSIELFSEIAAAISSGEISR
jgi:hypothetical protein